MDLADYVIGPISGHKTPEVERALGAIANLAGSAPD